MSEQALYRNPEQDPNSIEFSLLPDLMTGKQVKIVYRICWDESKK